MRYDESDNVLIRATRTFTDKVSDVFGEYITDLVIFFVGDHYLL